MLQCYMLTNMQTGASRSWIIRYQVSDIHYTEQRGRIFYKDAKPSLFVASVQSWSMILWFKKKYWDKNLMAISQSHNQPVLQIAPNWQGAGLTGRHLTWFLVPSWHKSTRHCTLRYFFRYRPCYWCWRDPNNRLQFRTYNSTASSQSHY